MITRIHEVLESFWKPIADMGWTGALVSLGAAIADYLVPQSLAREALGIACALMAIDTLTGMRAAIEQGKPLSSKRFSRLLTKIVGYSCTIASVSLMTKVLPQAAKDATTPLVTLTVTAICVAEFVSILENVSRMNLKLPGNLLGRLKRMFTDEIKEKEVTE